MAWRRWGVRVKGPSLSARVEVTTRYATAPAQAPKKDKGKILYLVCCGLEVQIGAEPLGGGPTDSFFMSSTSRGRSADRDLRRSLDRRVEFEHQCDLRDGGRCGWAW